VTCVCREADITKERIQKILSAGANVILTSGGIDDLCLKYFVESGTMAVRRCKKIDLRRIAKATGGEWLYWYSVTKPIYFLLRLPCPGNNSVRFCFWLHVFVCFCVKIMDKWS